MNVLTISLGATTILLLAYVTVPVVVRRICRTWKRAAALRRAENQSRAAARLRHPLHAKTRHALPAATVPHPRRSA